MLHRGQFSRRTVLRNALAAGAVFAAPNIVRGAVCGVTPKQVEGPFYMNNYDPHGTGGEHQRPDADPRRRAGCRRRG